MNKYELESIMENLSLSGRVGIDENRTSSKPNSKKDAIINSIVSKIKSKTNLPAKDIKEYLCGYGDSDRIATGKKLKEVYDTKMINRYKDECRQFDESTEYYDKYDSIYNIIQESLDTGDITLEEAEVLNDYAYDRYMEATRLAKEIYNLNDKASSHKSKDVRYAKRGYTTLLNNAGLEPDQKNNFTSSRGAHGYLGTDSLGEGRRTARDIASKQYKDIENIRSRGRYSKYQQREVFKTEPVDTSYYDAKKNHTEEVKKRRHDENTSVKKQRIQYQRDETNKIKNPLKKNIQKLNDKKGEKDIERDYRKQKRDINKGKYTYMYGEKEKLKELIKNRKQGK